MQLPVTHSLQTQDADAPAEAGSHSTLKPVVGLTDREATLDGDTHPYHLGLITAGVVILLIATVVIRKPFFRRRQKPDQSTSLPIA